MNNEVGGGHCLQEPREHQALPDSVLMPLRMELRQSRGRLTVSLRAVHPPSPNAVMCVTWMSSTSTGQTKDGRIKTTQFRSPVTAGHSHRWPGKAGRGFEGHKGGPHATPLPRSHKWAGNMSIHL